MPVLTKDGAVRASVLVVLYAARFPHQQVLLGGKHQWC